MLITQQDFIWLELLNKDGNTNRVVLHRGIFLHAGKACLRIYELVILK